MATVNETIPDLLRPEVDAALAWFNESQERPFEVTGIIDPEESLPSRSPRALKLVLCGGDTCQLRSFRVTTVDGGFEVALSTDSSDVVTTDAEHRIQAELDPPPGARRRWLASALSRHRFVVLVFYRGFW